jgi:hypothetical protein
MFKKALSKLKKIASGSKEPSSEPSKTTPPHTHRVLTAEGWKRLMMKKYRKSS